MTDLYVWLAAATLVAAGYLAALKLALLGSGRLALEQQLEDEGMSDAASWLAERFRPAIFVVSLLDIMARLGLFVLVLAEVGHLRTETGPQWIDLLVAGLVSVPVLWVITGVLAAALARYVGRGIIAGSLPALRLVTTACYPLLVAVAFIDEAIRRLSGANLNQGHEREAQLLRSIDQTHREGGLDEEAAAILENVVEFTSTDAAEIMTPRTDIESIIITDDLARIRSFITEVGHSRIPVHTGNVDHIIGILYVRDLVPYLGADGKDFKLKPILRQPIIVPQTKPVGDLLAEFQRSEVHMAIVVDEYGGTAGLVTIEDVLEEIVGEIRDEHEPDGEEEPALVSIDQRHVEVDGRYNLDDLNEELGLTLPENEDFDTVAGFILAHLGHVPKIGEAFEAHNARFTAILATARHVKRVGIELLGRPSPNGERVRKMDRAHNTKA